MSYDKFNMLQFTVALVAEFALRFGISQRQALNYLVRFKGMQHLEECYDVLHTLGSEYLMEDITEIIKERGINL